MSGFGCLAVVPEPGNHRWVVRKNDTDACGAGCRDRVRQRTLLQWNRWFARSLHDHETTTSKPFAPSEAQNYSEQQSVGLAVGASLGDAQPV